MFRFSWIRRLFRANQSPRRTNVAKRRPRLLLENLEDRTAPAIAGVFFVNDNWHITADIGVAGPSLGDTVTNVNDVGAPAVTANYGVDAYGAVTSNAVNPGAIGSTAAFDNINDAIGTAIAGNMVIVLQGSYSENVILNKSLTLRGAESGVDARGRVGAETILTPLVPTLRTLELQTGAAGSTIDGFTFQGGFRSIESTSGPLDFLQIRNNRLLGFTGSGIFLNDPGIDIDVNQNVLDGSSQTGSGALLHLDTDGFAGFQLTNNHLVNGGSSNTGFFVDGNHNVGVSFDRIPLISGNLFDGNATGANLGTRAFGSLTLADAGVISNNIFSNNDFDGLQGGMQNVLITRNQFTGNGRSGLALTSFGNAGVDRGAQNNLITENFFSANTTQDLFLSSTQAVGTIATNDIFDNSFTSATAITYGGTETIQASGNWFGTNVEASVVAKIAGLANVDITPFLDLGTDTDLATPGFQGDFSALHVTAQGDQAGAVGRIQEAINLLVSTGTVMIESGAYTENVSTAAKAVTLAIEGAGAAGQVTINGNLTLDSNDTVAVDISGITAGAQFDQFVVNGVVTLNNATLTLTNTMAPPASDATLKIIDGLGAIVGTFNGLPEGAEIVSGGVHFIISYAGGDVTLTAVSAGQTDDFNRPTSTDLGPNWFEANGDFVISGQRLTATNAAFANVAVFNRLFAADVSVQADITLPATGFAHADLVARYQGPGDSNQYVAAIIANNGAYAVVIAVNVNGVWTQLEVESVSTGTGTLRFDVLGDSLKVFLNGNLVASAVDSSLKTAGLSGVRGSQGATFDNFVVSELVSTFGIPETFISNLDNFTQAVGNMAIQGGTLAPTSGDVNVALFNEAFAADVSVQVDVNLPTSGFAHADLVARYQGPGDTNMYAAALVANNGSFTALIAVNVNGAWSVLGSQTVGIGSGTLRFDVLGDSFKLFLNGTRVVSVVDASLAAAGLAGVRGSVGASFDNFVVNPFSSVFGIPETFTLGNDHFTTTAGDFALQAGALTPISGGLDLTLFNLAYAADVSVQASVSLPTSGFAHADLVARYQGGGDANMYAAALISNNGAFTALIAVNVNGSWNILTSRNIGAGTGTLRFDVLADSLKLFLDGNLILSAVDASLPTAGLAGVRGTVGAAFDNFVVTELASTFGVAETFSGNLDNFTQTVGGMSIQAGRLTPISGATNIALFNKAAAADVSVQTDVTLPASGFAHADLVARYQGPGDSNQYVGAIVANNGSYSALIAVNVNGAWTVLNSRPIASANGALRFDVLGDSFKLFLNGTLLVSAVDASFQTAGLAGVRGSAGATFDNFVVNPLASVFGVAETFSGNLDNFTQTSGSMVIQAGQLVAASASTNLAAYNLAMATDVNVQADVNLPGSGFAHADLVARYSGPGDLNMYAAVLLRDASNNVTASIYRNLNGTWTQLAVTNAPSASGTLRLEVQGNSLRLYLNGALLTQTVDSAITGPGLTGVRASAGVTFDNFIVTE